MADKAEGGAMTTKRTAIYAGFYSAAVLLLAGCGATMTQIKVPVPVQCREETPARPAMPTETLDPAAALDVQARAFRAEIDRREGYEGELRTALANCTRPLAPP